MFTPTQLTVTASPFTWTNNTLYNVQLFIGNGTVDSLTLNGVLVPTGIWNCHPLILNPLDVVIITYTDAPTVYYKPF